MTTPGVTVGQSAGTTNQFVAKHALWAIPDLEMNQVASAGVALTYDTVAGAPFVKLATSGTTLLAGILGENTFDPSALPAGVAANIFAANILLNKEINSPTTTHKLGRFFLTSVNGLVNFGDFVVPDTSGFWKSNGAANPILNGALVCIVPNSIAGGPIEVTCVLA